MRTVIRHPHSGLYFRDDGQWGRDWNSAKRFANTIEALDFCLINRLWEYQIILKHEEDVGQPGFSTVPD
jgi:hypothetical protein